MSSPRRLRCPSGSEFELAFLPTTVIRASKLDIDY